MASVDYWAEPPVGRRQRTLFAPTLDDMIPPDDAVRLVDEVLAGADWTDWEAEYDRRRGQPPIHPRYVAAAMLYGLCRGLRSTRKLEEACAYRMDFMWLVEGRRIDHTTFAKFRTRFGKKVKQLFRELGRVALTLGLIRLGEVAFDGTRVKAYNSRFHTRTAATLEEKLAELDAQFDQMLAEFDAREQQETLEGHESPTTLPAPLADLDARRQRVKTSLDKVRALDEQRRKEGIDPQKHPAQVPTIDVDARVMPNKEGGFAPNYTPIATTDGQCGFIVDGDVLGEINEGAHAAASVDRIEENFGQKPGKFLTDSGNTSGAMQQAMEQRGVELYIPVATERENPAQRDDPTQPVAEADWERLPRTGKERRLDKSCFIYDAQNDQYYCPLGQTLPREKWKSRKQQGQRVQSWVYQCQACDSCPLKSRCVSPQSRGGRTITRDEFEPVRERTAQRMQTPEAQELYDQRPKIAETTFGILKNVFGLRQFLLSGQAKVKIEWDWTITAFNMKKLASHIARLRAEFRQTLETSIA